MLGAPNDGSVGGGMRSPLHGRWSEQVAVTTGHANETGDDDPGAVEQLLVCGVFGGDFEAGAGGVSDRGDAGFQCAASVCRSVENLLLHEGGLAPHVKIGAIGAGVTAQVDVAVDQAGQ